MLDVFEKTFFEVRKFLLSEGFQHLSVVQKNPRKEDVSKGFDYFAEEKAINFLSENLGFPVKILTEERGEIPPKEGEAKYVLVIDPVDGSTNFGRKIESVAFSIAAIPAKKPLQLENVEFALVGSIFSGNVFKAQKGKGAFYNNERAFSSKEDSIEKACVGIDLDFKDRSKLVRVKRILEKAKYIRRGGSAALDTAYVSNGACDACLDVRGMSTVENFIADYLLIKEAGGIFTDAFGNKLPKIQSLGETFSWVASGNQKLHKEIVGLLEMD